MNWSTGASFVRLRRSLIEADAGVRGGSGLVRLRADATALVRGRSRAGRERGSKTVRREPPPPFSASPSCASALTFGYACPVAPDKTTATLGVSRFPADCHAVMPVTA